jgi:hypothetical protein
MWISASTLLLDTLPHIPESNLSTFQLSNTSPSVYLSTLDLIHNLECMIVSFNTQLFILSPYMTMLIRSSIFQSILKQLIQTHALLSPSLSICTSTSIESDCKICTQLNTSAYEYEQNCNLFHITSSQSS